MSINELVHELYDTRLLPADYIRGALAVLEALRNRFGAEPTTQNEMDIERYVAACIAEHSCFANIKPADVPLVALALKRAAMRL